MSRSTTFDLTELEQAEQQVRRLAHLQATVAALGQRALRSETSAEVLDNAVTLVASTLDVEFCNVLELLPGGAEFLLRAGVGWKEGCVGRVKVPSAGTQPGYTVRSDRPVVVEDAAREKRFVPMPVLPGETVASALSVVISTREGPYGSLGAHSRRRRTFSEDEVNFLQAVANILGAVIERNRMEEQLRRSNRAYRTLSRCNQALIRSTDEPAWLEQICRIVVEDGGYRFCWVGYAEPDEARTVRPVAHAGFEAGYLQTVNITWADVERGRGPVGTCIRTGRIVLVKDMASDPRFGPWREEALQRGYASCLAIPLLADPAPRGALTVYAAEPDAFADEEISLLTELAADLAFGVAGVRTRAERKKAALLQAAHEQELEIGLAIQQTLLLDPLPGDVPGLRLAALTVPSQPIDGDFYQFFPHEDHCLDLVVADVMGKGIPAALLAAATKSHFLKALSHLMGASRNGRLPEPREIVARTHEDMVQHLIELESFVTLCYVRFDPNRGRLDLVDCGHTGLIRWRAATGQQHRQTCLPGPDGPVDPPGSRSLPGQDRDPAPSPRRPVRPGDRPAAAAQRFVRVRVRPLPHDAQRR
jgi:GAF domain-containing protein